MYVGRPIQSMHRQLQHYESRFVGLRKSGGLMVCAEQIHGTTYVTHAWCFRVSNLPRLSRQMSHLKRMTETTQVHRTVGRWLLIWYGIPSHITTL